MRVLKEICSRRILFVVDNFDVTDDPDLELFCSGAYSVLFTTRNHQGNAFIPELELKEMQKEEDLLALFKSAYTRTLDAQGLASVKDIIRQLKGHTLSICLAASAMCHRRISPQRMAELLRSGEEKLQEENSKAADMIFGRLHKVFQLDALSEDELYLMENLVLVPVSGIEVERLYDAVGADDFDVIDELIRRNWVIHSAASDEVHLHPLIADLCLERLKKDPSCCERYTKKLYGDVLNYVGTSAEWKWKTLALVSTAAEKLPPDHPMRWKLRMATANISADLALGEKCLRLCTELLQTAADSSEKMQVYDLIAHQKLMEGNEEESREAALKGIAIAEKIPMETMNVETGTFYEKLCTRVVEASAGLGDFETGAAWVPRALELSEKFHEHSYELDYGWCLFHVGALYQKSGHPDTAETYFKEARALLDRIGDVWGTSVCDERLSMIIAHRGSYEEALALLRKSLDSLTSQIGENHRDIAANYVMRGMIFRDMRNRQAAEESFRRAAEIYHQLNFRKKEADVLQMI